ncbi:MAG: tetratricopeptide repeat protein [Sphingobacteriales bacterium]|nr:MAG: tetratricopeptide repeat protein [Sphingobacteriales bacterium]
MVPAIVAYAYQKQNKSENGMRYLSKLIFIVIMMLPFAMQAQERKLVREGNKLYDEKRFKEAANSYQQALGKNPNYTPGMFNLGNSMYQQKQYDAARKVMTATAKAEKDKNGKSAANYNIGNTYMQEQKWEDAVNAYKQALRNNPQDADAKYNLSYAQTMLKKQQGGGGGGKDKDKKDDKKDKNKDNKDQQNKDDNKQDKNDQNKNDQNKKDDKQDNKDKQDQKPQPQASKLSQKQAEQLLNALQQEEKKLQDKHQKGKGVPVKIDKDW